MLSYIASNPTKDLIEDVCKELNITILSQIGEIDFLQYIKETKVNFKLIKYIIIDLKSLKGTEENIINSISYFYEVYPNIRIIILASGYDDQNEILTSLYEKGIYNIINSIELEEIKIELKKSLISDGLSKKDSKKFKKIEIIKAKKSSKFRENITKLRVQNKERKSNNESIEKTQVNSSVYFFTLLIQALNKLLELLGTAIIFGLTSLGLTIIFNESLRNAVFQIFGLK